jgi:hypothetical protein
MATLSKDAQQRSAAAAVKAERALDKVAAMQEYEAEALALQANTERLRALRLAREAESKQNPVTQRAAKKQAAEKPAAQGPTLKEPKKAPTKKRASTAKRTGDTPPDLA